MTPPETIPPKYWITTEQPLTKRERFAMAAMQGVCGSQNWNGNIADTAKDAIRLADTLVAALKSTTEPE